MYPNTIDIKNKLVRQLLEGHLTEYNEHLVTVGNSGNNRSSYFIRILELVNKLADFKFVVHGTMSSLEETRMELQHPF